MMMILGIVALVILVITLITILLNLNNDEIGSAVLAVVLMGLPIFYTVFSLIKLNN